MSNFEIGSNPKTTLSNYSSNSTSMKNSTAIASNLDLVIRQSSVSENALKLKADARGQSLTQPKQKRPCAANSYLKSRRSQAHARLEKRGHILNLIDKNLGLDESNTSMQSHTSQKSQSSLSKYGKPNRNPLSQQQPEQQQQSQQQGSRKKRGDESPKRKGLGIANIFRREGKEEDFPSDKKKTKDSKKQQVEQPKRETKQSRRLSEKKKLRKEAMKLLQEEKQMARVLESVLRDSELD
jgi:hypothetical protein